LGKKGTVAPTEARCLFNPKRGLSCRSAESSGCFYASLASRSQSALISMSNSEANWPSSSARVPTPAPVLAESQPNIDFCLLRMAAKINRSQKSHVASLADSERWGIVRGLDDPEPTYLYGSCSCLLRNLPLTCMLREFFLKILGSGCGLPHEFRGSEEFQMTLGTTGQGWCLTRVLKEHQSDVTHII
jgi:hypothetical protein